LIKSILRRASRWDPKTGTPLRKKRTVSKDEIKALLSHCDRWGGTPLSDAVGHNHADCVKLLSDAGATKGNDTIGLSRHEEGGRMSRAGDRAVDGSSIELNDGVTGITVCDSATQLLYACAHDELDLLVRLRASGGDLLVCDYDHRTAMHLAASTGSALCLKYLLGQTNRLGKLPLMLNARDRFGNMPIDDSKREGHTACTELLSAAALAK
jgi:ankyrin repeat protein